MAKTWTYRLWKSLTKRLVKNTETLSEVIRRVSSELDSLQEQDTLDPFAHRDHMPEKVVVFRGFFRSGSSVLSGLFCEFDNVSSLGNPEQLYCKKKRMGALAECHFFSGSRFCEMVQSFRQGTPATQDGCIKQFIFGINNACINKATCSCEYVPHLYNDYFKQIADEFLYAILDLDDATRKHMQGKAFPVTFESSDDHRYDGCSFLKGEGLRRYLFYKFREMPGEEFDAIVTKFLKGFFSILGEHEIVTYDQLLPRDYLETVNYFLKDNPIRQICVYRDPRDQFVAILRCDVNAVARDIDGFEAFYKSGGLESMISTPNPYRLVLRFEDLILKYEESRQKVLDFLGIEPGWHARPRSVYDPAISVNNIGGYKHFEDKELLRQIEERLSEYCYHPEKENLSPEAWALLESTGNWTRPTTP